MTEAILIVAAVIGALILVVRALLFSDRVSQATKGWF